MRTHVYVDGFNLYYGCVRGTPYKWLDIAALFRRLLPPNDLRAINHRGLIDCAVMCPTTRTWQSLCG